jgi:hypothetical protein
MSGEQKPVFPLTGLGDPAAMACEGDACLLPAADEVADGATKG